MKNFEQILSDAGVELTDEQKTTITKEMGENYKTVADWQKQHDKVQTLEETLKTTKTLGIPLAQLVSLQQSYEVAINNCTSQEELDAIEIVYDVYEKAEDV